MTAHVQPSTYEAQLRASYTGAAARLSIRPQPKPPEGRLLVHVRPDADHHVRAWKDWRRLYQPLVMPHEFVRLWCKAFGVDHARLLSDDRRRALCQARKDVAFALVARYPRLSTTNIGKLLNREHTSVLYFMGKTKRAKEHAARQAAKQARTE